MNLSQTNIFILPLALALLSHALWYIYLHYFFYKGIGAEDENYFYLLQYTLSYIYTIPVLLLLSWLLTKTKRHTLRIMLLIPLALLVAVPIYVPLAILGSSGW